MGRINNLTATTWADNADNFVIDTANGTRKITKKDLMASYMAFGSSQAGNDGTFQLRQITDMNKFTNSGYGIVQPSTTNLPEEETCKYGTVFTLGNKDAWFAQIFIPNTSSGIYVRTYSNNTFAAWKCINYLA